MKVTIKLADLIDLNTLGVLSGSDKARRPILTGVLYAVEDGKLTATATDSYVLGTMSRDAERDYLESVEDGSAIIDPKSLSDAIKAIQGTVRARGASRNATQYVTLATTGDVAKLEHWSVDYPIRTIEGTYPQTQTLWPTQKTLDESTTSTIVLDPRFMAKFAKVAPWCNDKTSAMRVELNDEVRPAVLTSVDKSTRCMIMPVRIK